VRRRRALLVGRAVADGGLADDQRGALAVGLSLANGGLDSSWIVPVDRPNDLPVVGGEALRHVLGEGEAGAALDLDAVAVIQVDQLAKLPRACQRCCLGGDAFLQVAVGHQRIRVVIDHGGVWRVDALRQRRLGQRHAHAH